MNNRKQIHKEAQNKNLMAKVFKIPWQMTMATLNLALRLLKKD